MIEKAAGRAAFAAVCIAAFAASSAAQPVTQAQTVGNGLASLLTDQAPAVDGYVRDRAAADATLDTVASLFQTELSSMPVASSSGGFVYRFSSSLGTAERSSDSFGPLFTDRALRNGRGQASFGVVYQFADFKTLQGADLTTGTFPANAARAAGAVLPFSVDTLAVSLGARTLTGFASYGVTDRLDVGLIAPVTTLRFSGTRVNTFRGTSTLQASQARTTTGLGDLTVNARYRLTGAAASGLALGTDMQLPTGREEDLLGSGKTAWRVMGIGSWERGRVAADGNAGFGVGGISDELFWAGALTFSATPRLSLVGELIGRRYSSLTRVEAVYQPHPVLEGIETMRWLPTGGGLATHYLSTGAKLNLFGSVLLKANILTRLTDTGLKARFTPALAVDVARTF